MFSEIYYPVGWKAYIDGQKAEHFRVDYILRGMVLPEGEHTVTFKYIPDSYYTSAKISQVASSLLILLFVAFIVLYGGGFIKHPVGNHRRHGNLLSDFGTAGGSISRR